MDNKIVRNISGFNFINIKFCEFIINVIGLICVKLRNGDVYNFFERKLDTLNKNRYRMIICLIRRNYIVKIKSVLKCLKLLCNEVMCDFCYYGDTKNCMFCNRLKQRYKFIKNDIYRVLV